MTPAEIARLRALCEKATPGPWTRGAGDHWSRQIRAANGTDIAWIGGIPLPEPDAAFIAEARTALPAALDEIERLRDMCEAARTLEAECNSLAEKLEAARELYRQELGHCDDSTAERDRLRAENESLKAEMVRLTLASDKLPGVLAGIETAYQCLTHPAWPSIKRATREIDQASMALARLLGSGATKHDDAPLELPKVNRVVLKQPTTVVCDCGKTHTIGLPGATEGEPKR